jgi:hypothetical protein
VKEVGKLAKETNTLILPADVGNIGAFVATVTTAMKTINSEPVKPSGESL